MDPVDILHFALESARMIRNSPEPAILFEEAWHRFAKGSPPTPDTTQPWSVCITQLVEAAKEQRGELYAFLRQFRGQCYLNRNKVTWDGQAADAEPKADPEAIALLQHIYSAEGIAEKVYLFLSNCNGPFEIGRGIIIHTLLGCGPDEEVELPTKLFGLIDDPLEYPVLFQLEREKHEDWNLFDILTAFARQYHAIYANPQVYGVKGHDLSDLWIEQLKYYPSKELIYPYIGT